MNLNLAGYYDNSEQEDLAKTAEAELFAKLAMQEGIDIAKLSDEQVTELYDYVMHPKTASEETKEETKDEGESKDEAEAKEAAAREHAVKLAYARDAAQADELGRQMARSYVEELNKIGSDLLAKQAAAEAEAGAAEGTKEAAMPEHLAKALGRVKEVGKSVGEKAVSGGFDAANAVTGAARKVKDVASKGVDLAKKHKTTIGVGAGSAAVGAGAGYAAGRKKESSAIDKLALEHAVKLAHAANFDADQAARRLLAAHELDLLAESTKMASTLDAQVHLRALELLESVGYPVNWEAAEQA